METGARPRWGGGLYDTEACWHAARCTLAQLAGGRAAQRLERQHPITLLPCLPPTAPPAPALPAVQLTTPGGERYWYSPVLRRASLEVPAMPAGGFCAEEMGLGKVGRAGEGGLPWGVIGQRWAWERWGGWGGGRPLSALGYCCCGWAVRWMNLGNAIAYLRCVSWDGRCSKSLLHMQPTAAGMCS